MPLHIEMEVQRGLLLVVVNGALSFDESWCALMEICDTAVDKQLNRILVDMLAALTARSTIERYSLGTKFVTYCGERKLDPRLAVVGNLPVVDGFGVLVAKNRGLTAEVFPSRQEALEWLNAELR
jgi:hypothetical protein